jgi:hypothetical protein
VKFPTGLLRHAHAVCAGNCKQPFPWRDYPFPSRGNASSPTNGAQADPHTPTIFPLCGSWTRPHGLLYGLSSISTDRHVHAPALAGTASYLRRVAGDTAEDRRHHPDHAVRGHRVCLDPRMGRVSVPENPVASDLTQPKASIDGAPPERSGSNGASSSCPRTVSTTLQAPCHMQLRRAPPKAARSANNQRGVGCQGGCDRSIDSASASHCEVQGRASVRLCAVRRHPFGRPQPISKDTLKFGDATHFRVESARMRCVLGHGCPKAMHP